MRIPNAYYENMSKRYKKSKTQDQDDYSFIERQQDHPLLQQLISYEKCENLNNPFYNRIIMDNIDKILECSTLFFKNGEQEKAITCFGDQSAIFLWDVCLKCCDLIIKFNPRQVEMFFSLDHLVTLLIFNPDYDIKKTFILVNTIQFLILQFNSSKLSKFRIDLFEKSILRFLYLNTFLQKSIFNLSNQQQGELFQLSEQFEDHILNFTLPSEDMVTYNSYLEVITIRKYPAKKSISYQHNFQMQNPLIQSREIAKQYDISEDSILFDQIFIRLLSHVGEDEKTLQTFFFQNYTFYLKIAFSEITFIHHKFMTDLSQRQIDQKDFLFILIRMINKGLNESIAKSLSFIVSKQVQLFEQSQFLEKLWLFELQVIQDTLLNYIEQTPMTYDKQLQQLCFQQLQDSQVGNILKKQSSFSVWNYQILQLLKNSLDGEGNLVLPNFIMYPLIQFMVTQITELPINSVSQVLEYHFENAIINTVMDLLKRNQQIKFKIKTYQILLQLTSYYKLEYDQVQIQNAQQEFMVPLPERYHKILATIWDQKILQETLVKTEPDEQLYQSLIQIMAYILGENPARVREFYESKGLIHLITCILELLQRCGRGSPLIVILINLLISISTNEEAISLALQNNDINDNLIKKIFIKCYMPSQELTHDSSVSDEFAKKIIMLYSQSQLAKRQIEKVIEWTFVSISQMVDLSKEKIEEIVLNQQKLQSFYSYSKSLQALLQLFTQLQPEKRSYRSFQQFEDVAQEEAQKQKDILFNSLLRNQKFVDALEKIIMSPILIGSKNKDTYVEHYVSVLYRKNFLNPYVSLWKELELIQGNYMILNGQKVIDIGKLVDYQALSVHMSERYFFRKIIKHISPETYRGFYIMSRFHLIHYLIKMCRQQNNLQQLQDLHIMVDQLLEIYFLSSQHAGFHESIMMTMSAKTLISKQSCSYEEDIQIKRKISKDSLIPLQQSCLDLVAFLQNHATPEQKELIIKKYGQIIMLFFSNIEEKKKEIELNNGIQVLSNVTYIQDMLKSAKHIIKQFFQLENQFQPLQFLLQLEDNKQSILQLIHLVKLIDEKIKNNIQGREQDILKKILPSFQDAVVLHIDNIIKELFFRKILLDRVILHDKQITDQTQLEAVANELIISISQIMVSMIDAILETNCDGQLKSLLQCLISKFQNVREMSSPEVKKIAGVESKEQQLIKDKDIVSLLAGAEAKKEAQKKQSLFERPEVKAVLEMVQDMGFPERLARKAIKRIEIPEPTMIIDMLLQGKVSDDEEEPDELVENEDKNLAMHQLMEQLIRKHSEQQENQEEQQKQNQQVIEIISNEEFTQILDQMFPNRQLFLSMEEQCNQLFEDFRTKLDQMLAKLIDEQLQKNRTGNSNGLLEYLFSIVKRLQPTEKILDYIFKILFQQNDNVAEHMNQISNALQWLQMLQNITPPQHEQLYQHYALVDQESPKDQKYSLSFQQLIRIGFQLSVKMQTELIQAYQKESQAIQQLDIKDSTYQQILQKLSGIISYSNQLFELKQIILKQFCRELSESQKYLTKFALHTNQNYEFIVQRYWEQIEIYIRFLSQLLFMELDLQEQTQQNNIILEQFETKVLSNPQLKQQKEQSNYQQYFKSLIIKRSYSEKTIVIQLSQALNNYGLHNQKSLVKLLCEQQQLKQSNISKSLLQVILQLKVSYTHYEFEEQQPVFLENLLYLIAMDNSTITDIIQIQIRQALLNEHCDWYAQYFKTNPKALLQAPNQFIESPLQTILTSFPTLINNPILFQMIIDQVTPITVSNKFIELGRTHVPKPPPKNKEQAPQPPELVLRWHLNHNIKLSLNNAFIHIIDQLAQLIVDRFIEDNKKLIESIHQLPQQETDTQKSYLCSWDQLLRVFEMLLIKLPQLSLYLRSLKISVKSIPNAPTNFIHFLIKYVSWFGNDRLINFLHNYICDINLIQYSYGTMISKEVLQLLLDEINFDLKPESYYHSLQILAITTQLLTLQSCSLQLTDQQSYSNIFQKLISIQTYIINDNRNNGNDDTQLKLIQATLSKLIEPYLQAQVFHEQLKHGKYGEFFKIEQNTKDPQLYHYVHCLRNAFFNYITFPNYKGNMGSAQFFISIPQSQTTLREDQNNEINWPPYLSKRNLFNARQNNQRQVEEDVSDSDSDQDIIPIQENLRQASKINYSSSLGWGHDYYYENNEYVSKYGGREEERLRDPNYSILSQTQVHLQFTCKKDCYAMQFELPTIKIMEGQIEYNFLNQKYWTYSLIAVYFSTNDYFENKKQLLSKSYENQLKISVEYINSITRSLTSSAYFRNKQNSDITQFLSQFLNGTLNNYSVIQTSSYYNCKFGQAPNQSQSDCQANQLPIQQNDTQLNQSRMLSQISCIVLQNRVVLNGMPVELYDQNIIKAKLQSLMQNDDQSSLIPRQLELPDQVTQLNLEFMDQFDNFILDIIQRLIFDNFSQFPFNLVRQTSKCSRIGTKILILLFQLLEEHKSNFDYSLRILYLISQKIVQVNLKNLLHNAIEISPSLNRREKANLGKNQSIEKFNEIDEWEDTKQHPLLYIIQLITTYSDQLYCYLKSINSECSIPIEKNIIVSPLLNKYPNFHLHYLIQIIQGALIKTDEQKDNQLKQKLTEELQYSTLHYQQKVEQIIKRQATIFQHEDNLKIFEMFGKQDSEHQGFQELIFKSFGDKLQEPPTQPSFDPWGQQTQLMLNQEDTEQEEQPKRKVSAKIAHMEIDIITLLCRTLENPLLREQYANDIINILNSYARDKYKVEHSIRELSQVIQNQAKVYNLELEKKRKELREFTKQREKSQDYDPENIQYFTPQECELLKELNMKTPDPFVIQRGFQAIIGFLNMSIKEEQQQHQNQAKPSSNQTRAQIQQDKKKFSNIQHKIQELNQATKKIEEGAIDAMNKKEIRKLFINVLQTQQIHHLWLNVVETLLLLFNFNPITSLEKLKRKLQPLLECFLRLYQNIQEDQVLPIKLGEQTTQVDYSFFERNTSGSTSYNLQFGVIQMQQGHLQRTFSAIRDQNEMQLKIDELFTYLCVNGKRIINHLIHNKLIAMQNECKTTTGVQSLKNFKENDPLGFVFNKMSSIIQFANKKYFFELELDSLKNQEKASQRGRANRPNEQIELSIKREERLNYSLEKVLAIDKGKFRKCDLKIKYIGEKGQDEGGIRREWMTNIIKDILETDKFELNSHRFYRINPNKKSPDDLNVFKLLGRLLAKAIYDTQLVPAYLISPIYKRILHKRPHFDDLEHFNEGYYDTFLKFMNEETVVLYKDLFEFWIPEEYQQLIELNKMNIFPELLQDYFDKNTDLQDIEQQQQQQDQQQQQQEQQIEKEEDQNQQGKQKVVEKQKDSDQKNKKLTEDLTSEDLEKRKKNRLLRQKKKKAQITSDMLKTIQIQTLLSTNENKIMSKHRRLICETISKFIMFDEIKPQISSLRDAFFEILPKEYFTYMDWRDFQKLIIGVPSVDIDDLQNNTEYVNYDPNNQTIIWFWEVLKSLTDSEKADFLMFTTGSPLVPFGGFKNLRGQNGLKKFTITRDFNEDHLMKSHTCFNRIDLPQYSTKEIVRDKLVRSMKDSGQGFDLS